MKFLQTAVLVAGFALTAASPAFAAADAPARPAALDGTTILPDPSLSDTRIVPAAAVTAGVAAVSAATDGPLTNCSRRNPCATPTPARDKVAVTPAVRWKMHQQKHQDVHDAQAARSHSPSGKPDLKS